MSKNIKQRKFMKGLWETLLELQILRFFTTLAVLTIIFVLVLRFIQQTSVSSDKIKPNEATLGPSSLETMLEFTPIKTRDQLNQPVVELNSSNK